MSGFGAATFDSALSESSSNQGQEARRGNASHFQSASKIWLPSCSRSAEKTQVACESQAGPSPLEAGAVQVPKKQWKRRRLPGHSNHGCIRYRPLHRDHVWSYDFVSDRTEDGRQLKLLVVIDEYTRESLAIEVGRGFRSNQVVDVLRYLFSVRGRPRYIRSDNGPEFVSRVVCRWLDQAEVGTLFIAKGSPWENGYVESFNARLRDELLNRELFLSVTEAQWVIDRWRTDYNHHRPHGSLGYQTPAAFAAGCADSVRPTASLHQHNPITENCIT